MTCSSMRTAVAISLLATCPLASASFVNIGGASRTIYRKAFQSRALAVEPSASSASNSGRPFFPCCSKRRSSRSIREYTRSHQSAVSQCNSKWRNRARAVLAILASLVTALSARILPVAAAVASSATSLQQSTNDMVCMNVEAAFRIVFASLLGSTLGLEKASKKVKTGAGQRTMALVSLGACVFTICGQGFAMVVAREAAKGSNALRGIENASVDASRMASTITAGVGFLGAGVISNNRMPDGRFDPESAKRGLTTAATIWMAAAVGSSVGAGLYYAGVAFVLSSLFVLGIGERLDVDKSSREKVMPKIIGDSPVEVAAVKPLANVTSIPTTNIAQEYKAASLATGDNSKVSNEKTTWLEGLDDDTVISKSGQRSTSKAKGNISTQNVTIVSSVPPTKQSVEGGDVVNATSPVESSAAEVKEVKKVDQYVEKFLQKGGTIKAADVKKKNVADDEENESQQIIW